MIVFKCKMCGGSLEINNNETVVECEYCGTKQTLPRLDDDKKINLYDRANHFRRNNDYDKAMGIYEHILNEDNTDAEAYWSLVLCKYGIEYVEDPDTRKRIPTVNRAQYTSIYDDDNYKMALNYADASQKVLYEEEAKYINEIQKGILEISLKEEPFDVFICYKETDENGRRTYDSVHANDLYHQLTQEGFKVFFSRITLEDKIGTAYEPYIFAALNSSKAMIVLGTKPEYFNAPWVKNEWSRYLALIKQGQKKILIPAYRDMGPYDLPEEFSHLQAQDMGKIGCVQDLIRGIKKVVNSDEPKPVPVMDNSMGTMGVNVNNLIKRMYYELEDENWEVADAKCESILDMDSDCVDAYIGKLLVDMKCKKIDYLPFTRKNFEDNSNYKKIMRFADEELKKDMILYDALTHIKMGKTKDFAHALNLLESIKGWKNSDELLNKVNEALENYNCKVERWKQLDTEINALKQKIDKDESEIQKEITGLNTYIAGTRRLIEEYPANLAALKEKKVRVAELEEILSKMNKTKSSFKMQRKIMKDNKDPETIGFLIQEERYTSEYQTLTHDVILLEKKISGASLEQLKIRESGLMTKLQEQQDKLNIIYKYNDLNNELSKLNIELNNSLYDYNIFG